MSLTHYFLNISNIECSSMLVLPIFCTFDMKNVSILYACNKTDNPSFVFVNKINISSQSKKKTHSQQLLLSKNTNTHAFILIFMQLEMVLYKHAPRYKHRQWWWILINSIYMCVGIVYVFKWMEIRKQVSIWLTRMIMDREGTTENHRVTKCWVQNVWVVIALKTAYTFECH